MPKYSCKMERVVYVNVVADTEDEAMEYILTHNINQIMPKLKDYSSVYDSEELLEEIPMKQGNEITIDIREKSNNITEECSTTVRENLLMETAMRIMEVFHDMINEKSVDMNKVEYYGSIELLQLFRDWAREFEDRYVGSEEYEDDFIGLSDSFAQRKILEEFGKD